MKLQPLRDPNDLLDHPLFIIEVKPKAFTHLAPFYGIAKLPDGFLGFGEFGEGTEVELLNADGEPLGHTVADISRWMPFDPKGVRMSAVENVRRYVNARIGRRGLDPDSIHALDTGCPSEAELTITDLRTLLAEIDAQAAALKKARERCWSLCPADEFHGRVLEHAAECNSCGITRAEYERILYDAFKLRETYLPRHG